MAQLSYITTFFKASSRAENDAINKIRENCILVLQDKNHAFFEDKDYGKSWTILRTGMNQLISDLSEKKGFSREFVSLAIQKKAGQQNKHDFNIEVKQQMNTYSFIFELKFKNVPQFTQEHDSPKLSPYTLAEYWYDSGVIDRIINLYPKELIQFPKPTRDYYLANIKNNMYSKNKQKISFFSQFYKLEKNPLYAEKSPIYKEKEKIVHEGINAYLEKYGETFQYQTLATKFQKEQTSKVYGIWNPNKQSFEVLEYSSDSLYPIGIRCMKKGNDGNKNTIVLKTKDSKYDIHCLLRWKNTNGICTPAWQIKMERSAESSPTP
jgi:hypothetical protein